MTTLPARLMGPLDPFWGIGEEPIRWSDAAAPPHRLGLALPFALMGRPRRWMAAAGYQSGRARRIELALTGELVVDGDVLATGDGATITVTTATIRILSP